MKRSAAFLALVLVLLCLNGVAHAHKPSDSYLKLSIDGAVIDGQWDIALRDLDYAIGLDSDQDNAITWGEVKAKHAEIAAYALSRLTLGSTDSPCKSVAGEQLIDNHSDGAYAVLRFETTCPAAPASLRIDYRLFFDIDPQHRGLLNLSSGGETRVGILSAEQPSQDFALSGHSGFAQFLDYVKDGVWHIWSGFDHILFVLSLLLPAVLASRGPAGRTPEPAPGFRTVALNTFKVVTAFTLAHAVTLTLATLGVINVSSRLVESAIAATVVLAALNNIRPVVHGRLWTVAFGFGLIHGFGFASVLMGLGLPKGALLLALVAFNVGVELGQLTIVALFLAPAYEARNTQFYRRFILTGGSLAIAVIAAIWFVQRAFNIVLVPALGA